MKDCLGQVDLWAHLWGSVLITLIELKSGWYYSLGLGHRLYKTRDSEPSANTHEFSALDRE